MTTIAENLQTIKNSTDAIKQAIIDKGGTISGDITTWADAISGIESSGGSADGGEPVFQCNLTYEMIQGKCNITGTIDFGDNYPGPGTFYMFIDQDGSLRRTVFTSSDTSISFTGIYLYPPSYLMFAVYVPDSTNTYAVVEPDDPGGGGAFLSVKSFYKVNVTINNN